MLPSVETIVFLICVILPVVRTNIINSDNSKFDCDCDCDCLSGIDIVLIHEKEQLIDVVIFSTSWTNSIGCSSSGSNSSGGSRSCSSVGNSRSGVVVIRSLTDTAKFALLCGLLPLWLLIT